MASYIGGKNNENDNVGKNDNNYFDRKKKSGLRNGLRNNFYERKEEEKENGSLRVGVFWSTDSKTTTTR